MPTEFDDKPVKACNDCGTEKPLDEFARDRRNVDGLQRRCRECQRVRSALHYQATKADPIRSQRRLDKVLRSLYDLTVEEYNELLVKQEGRCKICRRPFDATPHLDHSHESGRVRGLLCAKCNHGIGLFGDDPEVLRRAALYVEAA